MWRFDRVFGDNKHLGWQVVYILAAVAVLVLFITGVGYLLTLLGCVKINQHDSWPLMQSLGLAFGTANMPGGIKAEGIPSHIFPLWWQAIAVILSAVVFSGVTITFVGNLLGNRQQAYREGLVRYWFEDHIIFFGGGDMVVTMLRQIWKDNSLHHCDIVIMTEADVPEVRLSILGQLDIDVSKLKLTFLRGHRDDPDDLRSVNTSLARRIYIVGDDPSDEDYDSVNMACWNEARSQCAGRVNMPCYLLLERASSEHIFRHNLEEKDNQIDKDKPSCFDTIVVNRLETIAQRVLVHNGLPLSDTGSTPVSQTLDCPPLDRGGIGPDSTRTVHLVIYGMTPFSYAMATSAAHLCHFPNFVNVTERDGRKYYTENLERRTRITFIAPGIKEEMDYFSAHMDRLFSMSKVTYNGTTTTPAEDFLDIEWEFVDGNIASPEIRSLLRQYYQRNQEGKTYLTLAICLGEARRNIAAALYLPDEFHDIVNLPDGSVDYDNTIPIFVYQPCSEQQLRVAHDQVPIYRNIFPIGTIHESYDPSIRQRILEGKRINYIYNTYDNGLNYNDHPLTTDSDLDSIWPRVYTLQKSNIHSANHIGVKFRSVGIDPATLQPGVQMPADMVPIMAVVEHNRWNTEKLLMGYGAVPEESRLRLKQLQDQGKTEECKRFKNQLKQLRASKFLHNCIAPYEQLLDADRHYDECIVSHLADVINPAPNTNAITH